MQPCLDSLILTDEELEIARTQVQEMAYRKWEAAGCPQDGGRTFWLEAEREWIATIYVPHRYPRGEKPN